MDVHWDGDKRWILLHDVLVFFDFPTRFRQTHAVTHSLARGCCIAGAVAPLRRPSYPTTLLFEDWRPGQIRKRFWLRMLDALSNDFHFGFRTLSTKPVLKPFYLSDSLGPSTFQNRSAQLRQDLVPSLRPWALRQVKDLSRIQQTGLDLFHLRGLLQWETQVGEFKERLGYFRLLALQRTLGYWTPDMSSVPWGFDDFTWFCWLCNLVPSISSICFRTFAAFCLSCHKSQGLDAWHLRCVLGLAWKDSAREFPIRLWNSGQVHSESTNLKSSACLAYHTFTRISGDIGRWPPCTRTPLLITFHHHLSWRASKTIMSYSQLPSFPHFLLGKYGCGPFS